MKKISRILIVLLCALISFVSLVACSGAPKHEVGGGEYSISRETLENTLTDFVENNENRSSFSDDEWQAALYLQEKLISYGYFDAEISEFAVTGDSSTRTSRNVKAVYSTGEHDKNVIIGAYYDNAFTTQSSTGEMVNIGTHGALSNGTGVATSLAIAEYLIENNVELDYNVSFVFFGASAVSVTGAQQYYKNMTDAERDNTILMIELQRIGVDHVYAFSDARKTKRETFFERIAKENKLDIYKVSQKSPVITSAYALNGVPYFQWAHSGLFPVFADGGIPTLNLVGANWETMNLADGESAANADITLTANDTLEKLIALYPDYSVKMAEAATLVVKSLTDGEFVSVMQYDADNYPHTDILTQRWIWYIVALAIILVALLLMLLVSSILNKKYPPEVPQPKNLKVAVFGMDYEDKDPNSVYIDIKNSKPNSGSIFPGVPDNDPFPQYGSPKKSTTAPVEKDVDIDPFEHAVIKAVYEEEKRDEQRDQLSENTTEQVNSVEEQTESKPAEETTSNDSEASSEQEQKEAEEKPAEEASVKPARKPATKRPTVSAGKSTGTTAKRSPTTHKPTATKAKSEEADDTDQKE